MMNLKRGVGFSLIHSKTDRVRSIRQKTNISGLISLNLTDTNEVTRKVEYSMVWVHIQARGFSPAFVMAVCSRFKKRKNISSEPQVARKINKLRPLAHIISLNGLSWSALWKITKSKLYKGLKVKFAESLQLNCFIASPISMYAIASLLIKKRLE
jgi:hypothetical protein